MSKLTVKEMLVNNQVSTIQECIETYLNNVQINDVDPDEPGMSEADPCSRLGGASVKQAKVIMNDFFEYLQGQVTT